MKREKVYYVGIHGYSKNAGIPAEIIGVEMITPDGLEPRLCYHIQWADLSEDWLPVHDSNTYKIISFTDILNGNIPKVI